jgi:AraC-like DNA-binding protein
MFKEELLNPLEDNSILQMIRQLNEVTHIHLENGSAFQAILEDILEVYQSDSSYARDILLGYLKVLFGKIASLSLSPSKSNGSAIPQSLCERFFALLPAKCPDLHKVSEYAALLHTSPQNLNQTCRKKIGKSAGELISDQLLLEAKRNILHTDQNINEIADHLHFNDASYFVKFFKKHMGETPHQYRARYFG